VATKSEYGQREIEAAKSVLIELMQILGEYHEQMVLIGSTDVDIALDREQITDDVYNTIRQHLEKRGYKQGEKPFIFNRELKIDEGDPVIVNVDFLAGEYGGTAKKHRHQVVQDDLTGMNKKGSNAMPLSA
jgi:hypothetical protein